MILKEKISGEKISITDEGDEFISGGHLCDNAPLPILAGFKQCEVAKLMGFYTKIEHRRKGYGLLATKLIIKVAKERNYKVIILGCDNVSRHLYEKAGFVRFFPLDHKGTHVFLKLIL